MAGWKKGRGTQALKQLPNEESGRQEQGSRNQDLGHRTQVLVLWIQDLQRGDAWGFGCRLRGLFGLKAFEFGQ